VDNFFDYRDPLFGVILFLCLVLIVFSLNYYFEYRRLKKEKNRLSVINNSFDSSHNLARLDIAINSFDIPFETILFIATTYYKNGDYENAIHLLLSLLKNEENKSNKEQILDLLGKVYFKAGFLQKSKDIFLKSLELYPRNQNSLKNLLIIYEMLRDYKSAIEVLEPLKELEVDVRKVEIYLNTLLIIDDALLTIDEKKDKLEKILKDNIFVSRIILDFFRIYDTELFWNNLDKDNLDNIIDLFNMIHKDNLNLDFINKTPLLQEFFTAKGILELVDDSSIFEFDMIINLNKNGYKKAVLSFEYICSSCKNSYPMYQKRCPSCQDILSLKPVSKIINNSQQFLGTF
jgi:tetratricopeptide (TPR) repeat protein